MLKVHLACQGDVVACHNALLVDGERGIVPREVKLALVEGRYLADAELGYVAALHLDVAQDVVGALLQSALFQLVQLVYGIE